MPRLPQIGEESWGDTLNDYLLTAHTPDGRLRTAAVAASGALMSGDAVYSVRDYGAQGDGMANDAPALQMALDAIAQEAPGATLLIPAGIYAVQAEIEIKSAVHIVLSPGAVVRRSNAATQYIFRNFNASDAAQGYNGRGGITVSGGVLDCAGDTLSGAVTAISFVHAANISVQAITVRNVRDWNAVELCGVRKAVISDCTFEGLYASSPANIHTEAVQLDMPLNGAAVSGISPAAYEAVPCSNITMRGCTVRPYGSLPAFGYMVGSHTAADGVWHRSIRIIDNYGEGLSNYPVRGYNWNDTVVRGNTFADCNGGVRFEVAPGNTKESENIVIQGNVFRNSGARNAQTDVAGAVISLIGIDGAAAVPLREAVIADNIIKGFATAVAIDCLVVADCICSGNVIKAIAVAAQTGIRLSGCFGALVTGNRLDGGLTTRSISIQASPGGSTSESSIVTNNSCNNVGPLYIDCPYCVVTGNAFVNPQAVGLTLSAYGGYATITGNQFRKADGFSPNAIELFTATALIQANSFRGWGGAEGTTGIIRRNVALSPTMITTTTATDNTNRYAA
jgi:hypothetical protein